MSYLTMNKLYTNFLHIDYVFFYNGLAVYYLATSGYVLSYNELCTTLLQIGYVQIYIGLAVYYLAPNWLCAATLQ